MTNLATPASPLSVGSVAQLTLSLAAIVALIFAISWIVKRLKLGTPHSRGDIGVIERREERLLVVNASLISRAPID